MMNVRKLRVESLEERALLAVVAGGIEHAAELVAPTEGTTWVVNTLDDPTEWDTADDILSLREAIKRANSGDTIIFDASLENGTIILKGQSLGISTGITIDASGIGGITVNANRRSRVFGISGGTSSSPVELISLTITGGGTKDYSTQTTLFDTGGGGIFNSNSTTTLTNCTITRNIATTAGGAIFNNYGTITMTNCTISENTATNVGGGVWNGGINASNKTPTITLTNCSISNNESASGGGIYSSDGEIRMTNCAVTNNAARGKHLSANYYDNAYGGGFYNCSRGSLTLINCSVTGNLSMSSNYGGDFGGGIYSDSTEMITLINCTISGNEVKGKGGGVYTGTLTAINSIIALNSAMQEGADVGTYSSSLTAYNTLSTFTAWAESENCILYDPDLSLFKDSENGDFTLGAGSQAINIGNNSYVTTETDLAGNPRIVTEIVDLGAYEYQPETSSTVVTTLEDIVNDGDGLISLREAVTLYADEGDTITFSPELAGGTIILTGSDIEITKPITIDASGTDGITIDANGKSRVFFMNTGRNPNPVELINLNLTGGNPGDGDGAAIYIHGGILHVTDSFIYGNSTGGNGGGICNHWGALEVTNSTIVENYARNAGGIMSYSGSLTVANCTISDNRARGWDGGGIRTYGSATVTDTIVSGNYANRSGGGIMASDSLTVINTLISGNVAKYGGGVWSNTEELIITSSIIQNNSASLGGGFYNERKLSLVNCLIFNNTSQEHGGGLYNTGNLTLTNTTVADNLTSANDSHGIYNEGSSYLFNSIIAQNESNDIVNVADKEIYAYSTLSSFEDWTESENSILYDPSIPLFSDEYGSDYSISGDSQAVNDGDNSYVTWDTDLSGNSRIVGEVVDLGAYEYPDYKQLESPSILTGVGNVYVSYGANRHQIIWDEVENASGYELAYSEDGGNSWDSIETFETNAIVAGLTYGKDVTYRVRALRNGLFITSEWSAEKSFNVCPMDINGDGDISGPDRLVLSSAWLAEEGDSRYQYYCDLDGDGNVANRDRLALSVNWLMEAGQEGLLYPRPLAADAVFAEFESGNLAVDFNVF